MYTDYLGKKWYKGNLHTHTVRSDGKVTVEEAAARYRFAGYDFLSLTDHWKPLIPADELQEGLLLLSGCEYHVVYKEPYYDEQNRTTVFHLNGIGFTSIPRVEESPELRAQAIVDAIADAEGLTIFNHPAWSHNTPEDIRSLKGLAGLEIYNTTCGFGGHGWHYPYSGFLVDQLAFGGTMMRVFATDDAHRYTGDECRSFVMVQAEDLSRDSIMEAMRAGRFYASQGPWVEAEVKDNAVHVRCSPAAEIRIFENITAGGIFNYGMPITGAVYPLHKDVYYYRVEVTDAQGNCAWTSPQKVLKP
jgi:hypothetical protein